MLILLSPFDQKGKMLRNLVLPEVLQPQRRCEGAVVGGSSEAGVAGTAASLPGHSRSSLGPMSLSLPACGMGDDGSCLIGGVEAAQLEQSRGLESTCCCCCHRGCHRGLGVC